MGRHRRTSAGPLATTSAPCHRRARRRPVRSGLLGASAAMAVGAVAVASGLIPAPGGLPGGYALGGGDGLGGNLAQPDGSPSTTTPAYPAPRPAPDGSAGASGPATGHGTAAATPPAGQPASSPAAAPSGSPMASPSTPPVGGTATPDPTAAAPTTAGSTPPASTGTGTGQAVATADQQVLALVDAERAKAGCQPLTSDPKLTELAQNFSDEMATRGFFDHTDPNGRSPWDRAARLGITDLGGENIARGQPNAKAAMDSWMSSPSHRANVLNCQYRALGVGVHFDSDGPWWTEDFGF